MPTYDYLCEKCGYEFEREQRITEDPVKTCPECRSRKVKRLLSAPGFILKGGGWYADGYGSQSASSGGSGGDSESASAPSSGSDSASSSSSSGGDGGDAGGKNKKKSGKGAKKSAA
jgi:putative FmdB family regulatory protein